jgi:hypothetical protein
MDITVAANKVCGFAAGQQPPILQSSRGMGRSHISRPRNCSIFGINHREELSEVPVGQRGFHREKASGSAKADRQI